jgi:hypothetical protein
MTRAKKSVRISKLKCTMKNAVNTVFYSGDRVKAESKICRYLTFIKRARTEEGEEFIRKYPFLHGLLCKEMVIEFSGSDREAKFQEINESIEEMTKDVNEEEKLKIIDSVVKVIWMHFL